MMQVKQLAKKKTLIFNQPVWLKKTKKNSQRANAAFRASDLNIIQMDF